MELSDCCINWIRAHHFRVEGRIPQDRFTEKLSTFYYLKKLSILIRRFLKDVPTS